MFAGEAWFRRLGFAAGRLVFGELGQLFCGLAADFYAADVGGFSAVFALLCENLSLKQPLFGRFLR